MTKEQYIGAYLDGYFSDKEVPYASKYFSMLKKAEKEAERKWKFYKKQKL